LDINKKAIQKGKKLTVKNVIDEFEVDIFKKGKRVIYFQSSFYSTQRFGNQLH
jgi:hypothetical protein